MAQSQLDLNGAALVPIEPSERALERYDPEKGLKQVAVAEAAVKHWTRARDLSRLYEAIDAKFGAMLRFVIWWDGLGEKDGRPRKNRNRSVTVLPIAGRDGMPDRMTIERWRKALKDEERFHRTIEAAKEKARQLCDELDKNVRGTQGTGENEWFTPPEYFIPIRSVLGKIDLDPATIEKAQEIVAADQFFTKEDDGLKQEWHGRIWLNPPYAQPAIGEFVSKMVAEWQAGRIEAAIMLTHNYTDTTWFHEAASCASAICFTRGRVKFYEPTGDIAAPTQGQAFFYFGPDVDKFAAEFRTIGFIVAPVRA